MSKQMTWHAMARIERGLIQLAEDARHAYYHSEPEAWMQIVGRLTMMVGPLSSGRLRTREAYRVARGHLQRTCLTGSGEWRPPTDGWEADDAASTCTGGRVLPARITAFGCPEPQQLATQLVSEASTSPRGHGRKEGLPVSGLVSGGLSQTPNQARTQAEGYTPYSGSYAG
jgi:hypothetical protein